MFKTGRLGLSNGQSSGRIKSAMIDKEKSHAGQIIMRLAISLHNYDQDLNAMYQ